MSKFTKGPWKVTPHLDVMKGHNYIAPISIMTKKYMTVNEETRANARLIAAAPEMYELLDYIASYLTALSKLIPLSGLLINYLSMINDLVARIDGEEERHE